MSVSVPELPMPQTGESIEEREFEAEVLPQTGPSFAADTSPQTEPSSEAMVTKYPRMKNQRVKRPRSPLPVEEASGPNIPSKGGGFVGNPGEIILKPKEFQNIVWRKKHLQLHHNAVVFRGSISCIHHFDCFNYYFNDKLLTKIAYYTNLGARQHKIQGKPHRYSTIHWNTCLCLYTDTQVWKNIGVNMHSKLFEQT